MIDLSTNLSCLCATTKSIVRNALSGSIPSEVGYLTALTFLEFCKCWCCWNHNVGEVSLWLIYQLTFLDCAPQRHRQLTMPWREPSPLRSVISQLWNTLISVRVGWWSGSIVIDLSTNLSWLCATTTSTEDNALSGSIPSQIADLTALTSLSFCKCGFGWNPNGGVVQWWLIYQLTFLDCALQRHRQGGIGWPEASPRKSVTSQLWHCFVSVSVGFVGTPMVEWYNDDWFIN